MPRRHLAQTPARTQREPMTTATAEAMADGSGVTGVLITRLLHTVLLAWLFGSAPVYGAPPLADVHVHYKWSQKEVTAAQQAIRILRDNDIALAVVIGTPAEYALELARLAPQTIIPIWSPYREPADWSRWPYDRKVLERARQAVRPIAAQLDIDGRNRPFADRRWSGKPPDVPVLHLEDVSAIPFVSVVPGVEEYQHRARVVNIAASANCT